MYCQIGTILDFESQTQRTWWTQFPEHARADSQAITWRRDLNSETLKIMAPRLADIRVMQTVRKLPSIP
jgi:hypothetical protein